jgi:hypothetical protein
MSTTTIQAEASKPQKKMQECRRCKDTGFPNQMIGFEKLGEDPTTGKIIWKLVNEDGRQHEHKSNNQQTYEKPLFKSRRVVDVAAVTDLQEAKKLLESGWEYKTSYPATIANIPHYILVKREKSQ